MDVSKDILEKMDSGTHFSKEVAMNMTDLAELITTCGDTVFTVQFHKKPNLEEVSKKLESKALKDLKDAGFLNNFTKELIEGAECTLVCHLVEAETALGRSTVIDLQTNSPNKFR